MPLRGRGRLAVHFSQLQHAVIHFKAPKGAATKDVEVEESKDAPAPRGRHS
jgi:hypothetical protein